MEAGKNSGSCNLVNSGAKILPSSGVTPTVPQRASKLKKKVKTEPTNPFGQFMKEKRAKFGKINYPETRLEWGKMPEDKKRYYVQLYEEEKVSLGDSYRAGRKKKYQTKSGEIQTDKSLPKRRRKKEKVPSLSNCQLLAQTQSLDKQIDQLHLEGRCLQDNLCDEKVKLAVIKYKLKEKTVETHTLKEKYKALLSQHVNCS